MSCSVMSVAASIRAVDARSEADATGSSVLRRAGLAITISSSVSGSLLARTIVGVVAAESA
jgi:hypothetical protein